MPRLRDTTHPMTRLLRGYDINGANLSKAIGCAPNTARRKLKDPERLTLGDLRAIHYKFGVPLGDMREAAF